MYANKLNVNNKQQVSREPSRASLVQQTRSCNNSQIESSAKAIT